MTPSRCRSPLPLLPFYILLLASVALSPLRAATDAQIAERLSGLVARAPKGAAIAARVERADSGAVVFERNAAAPMAPASNQKILTTAAALFHLGPDYRFQTELRHRGPIEGAAIRGDLVVVGSGDPTISGRFQNPRTDVTAIFRKWAHDLEAQGIHRIRGAIIGDDRAFDAAVAAPQWPENRGAEWYCAEISALIFNDGCVDVTWTGAGKPGAPATCRLNPSTGYLRILNGVQLTDDPKKAAHWFERKDKPNVVEAKGRTRAGREAVDSVSVQGATGYFVTVLKETLMAQGIRVDGEATPIGALADPSPFTADLPRLLVHESPALSDIVRETNLHSQNLFAETMFKAAGRKREGQGSFESGARAVRQFLESHHIPTQGLNIVDGSGLSRDNRVTAQALTGVLRAADAAPWREIYRSSFPVGARTGSLRDRFAQNGKDRQTAARIRAKTGYIRGVRALSGWAAQPEGGPEYRFSFLLNSGDENAPGGIAWLDAMALAIAEK